MKRFIFLCLSLSIYGAWAQEVPRWQGKFEQLDYLLPTPNEYRTGSGSPGPKYWQQKADYVIQVELNDNNQSITGSETITYHNNSPEKLTFLWLQLDQNILASGNMTDKVKTGAAPDQANVMDAVSRLNLHTFDGGHKIKAVKGNDGKALPYMINNTMMRVDLPKPLAPGEKYSFSIDWSYNIGDRMIDDQRSGLEYFPDDKNHLYTIAQFFPRMCVFDDYEGWQNKQFLGQGEFALPFGDYKVRITVPADHIIGATGMLQNPGEVLSKAEQERFEKAKSTFDKPVLIVTQAEAVQKEKTRSTQKKTWEFHAENVRDFAFASSRKFIWDAMAVKVGDKTPLAMSFYPKEGNPLWEQESTKAVKNTLVTYSKYTIDYPYPVAISVHTADIGMEYPMICFNWGRPDEKGKFDDRTKYRMIGVIVHEVGHNFFPMIINSDERQWTWMDEGLNTFLQYRTEVECYKDFPSRRGPAPLIVPYMKGNKDLMRPLMVNSEQIVRGNFGNEQYAKCATALNILRETVMGPELFDRAFKEYADRWAFKHPKPADFFRTMEDASAVDLDWFWRGWFYSTDNVNLSVDEVKWFRLETEKPNLESKSKSARKGDLNNSKEQIKNVFENGPEPFRTTPTDASAYGEYRNRLDDKTILSRLENRNIYEVTLSNNGGLVTPVVIEWNYKDGTREIETLPAEIWRTNEQKITKVFVKDKEVAKVVIDPNKETADVDTNNNVYPPPTDGSRFDQFKKNSN